MRTGLINRNGRRTWALVCTLLAAVSWTAGCSQEKGTPTEMGHGPGAPEGHDAHDDHAGHDHAEMGRHGGHIVVLDPGHVHAEWVHGEDDGTIEVYVLDNPEDVTGMKIVTEMEGQDPQEFELAAMEGDIVEIGSYTINSPNALTAIQMADGQAAKATLVVMTGSGEMSAALSDAGHDHDHDHAGEHEDGDHAEHDADSHDEGAEATDN